jgi:hypothetical protein
MADLIPLREWLTVRLPASIATTGLFAAGVDASGKTKALFMSGLIGSWITLGRACKPAK